MADGTGPRNLHFVPWTEEQTAVLRALWCDGITGAAIADRLWDQFHVLRSRCAVIGCVYRLKLVRHLNVQPRSKKVARPKVQRRGTGRIVAIQRARERGPRIEFTAPVELPPLAASRNVSLLDLKHGECKYPTGDPQHPDFGFCGLPAVGGQSWCIHHRAIVWQPHSPRPIRIGWLR